MDPAPETCAGRGRGRRTMNVLLVCPEYPDTFWSFKHALRFSPRGPGSLRWVS